MDEHLTQLGWTAAELTAHVAKATDETDVRTRGEEARAALEEFVTAASRQFNGDPST